MKKSYNSNFINLDDAKGLFVTGTGTDIGKTYVTGLLLKYIRDNGFDACYYKAALSGAIKNENGELIPGDAVEVLSMAGLKENTDFVVPYIYETPVSPHLASKIEGPAIEMDVIKNAYLKVANKYDYVIMEGSGGIVCPIRHDNEIIMLEDVIKELGLAVLIVADAGLGTINSIVTTVEYLKNREIAIVGIILNNYHNFNQNDIIEENYKNNIDTNKNNCIDKNSICIENNEDIQNIMEYDNILMVEEITGVPVIGKVAKNDENLELDIASDKFMSFFK